MCIRDRYRKTIHFQTQSTDHTCLVQIKCGAADWGVMTVAVAYLIFELCVRGGVILSLIHI